MNRGDGGGETGLGGSGDGAGPGGSVDGAGPERAYGRQLQGGRGRCGGRHPRPCAQRCGLGRPHVLPAPRRTRPQRRPPTMIVHSLRRSVTARRGAEDQSEHLDCLCNILGCDPKDQGAVMAGPATSSPTTPRCDYVRHGSRSVHAVVGKSPWESFPFQ